MSHAEIQYSLSKCVCILKTWFWKDIFVHCYFIVRCHLNYLAQKQSCIPQNDRYIEHNTDWSLSLCHGYKPNLYSGENVLKRLVFQPRFCFLKMIIILYMINVLNLHTSLLSCSEVIFTSNFLNNYYHYQFRIQ